MSRKRRWGDHDRHVGPFTFAFGERWRPFAAILSSGSTDEEEGGCHVRLQAFGCTLICELPRLIKPAREWVDTSRYDWNKGNPNAGYWDEHRREYGFSLSEGHLHLRLGRQTHDSSTTQDWGYFLPWTQWRQVSHRLFRPDGSFFLELVGMEWRASMDRRREAPRARFLIADHDGEEVTASAFIEERRWRRGTGWFSWLGYVAPRRFSRSIQIEFASEVGRDKGSWKGGMVGTGHEMLSGETIGDAFRRFCDEEHRSKHGRYRMTYLRRLEDLEVTA